MSLFRISRIFKSISSNNKEAFKIMEGKSVNFKQNFNRKSFFSRNKNNKLKKSIKVWRLILIWVKFKEKILFLLAELSTKMKITLHIYRISYKTLWKSKSEKQIFFIDTILSTKLVFINTSITIQILSCFSNFKTDGFVEVFPKDLWFRKLFQIKMAWFSVFQLNKAFN